MDIADPSNWAISYFLDDGLWRFLHLSMAMNILLVLSPQENSSKMAYSVEIPSAGTEDVVTDDVTPEAEETEQIKDSSWDEMWAAVWKSGPWIMRKIRRSDQ